ITGLAEHTGMIGFAMFTRGHIHDTTVPVAIQSWGALDFFREILKKDPVDVAALFELWVVSRDREAVLHQTRVSMNYENYISAIVEGKNVGLVGWPKGVPFKRMSKQSAIGPLRLLHEALKCGTCKWKIL
ncbi:hypothetical protein C8R44DRAFT_543876, partial [Mycena epipterygia]